VRQSPYEKMLQESVRGELRLVNTGLPQSQKPLADLLNEEHPHVVCNDGSTHLFKKSELEYLASMLDTAEQRTLLLPMLIELGTSQGEAVILCAAEVEEKIVSEALDMPVTREEGRIRIYKPQLALLRKRFKTTTVYIFSPKIVA
jgi:uncharacterized protein (UPF0216 family)